MSTGELRDKEVYCLNPSFEVNTSKPDLQLLICFEEATNAKYHLLPVGKFYQKYFLKYIFTNARKKMLETDHSVRYNVFFNRNKKIK